MGVGSLTANTPPLTFPTRGTPGGWRAWWDDPDDSAQLRARAEATERRLTMEAALTAAALRAEQDQALILPAHATPADRKAL